MAALDTMREGSEGVLSADDEDDDDDEGGLDAVAMCGERATAHSMTSLPLRVRSGRAHSSATADARSSLPRGNAEAAVWMGFVMEE